jgi:hypothetical protein
MEYNNATGLQKFQQMANRAPGIALVKQDVPASDCVELIWSIQFVEVTRVERNPGGTALPTCALARMLQSHRIPIYTEHASSWPDHLGDEQGDIPHSGSDLEYAHPGSNSRHVKELLCERSQDLSLKREPLVLVRRLTQNVVRRNT